MWFVAASALLAHVWCMRWPRSRTNDHVFLGVGHATAGRSMDKLCVTVRDRTMSVRAPHGVDMDSKRCRVQWRTSGPRLRASERGPYINHPLCMWHTPNFQTSQHVRPLCLVRPRPPRALETLRRGQRPHVCVCQATRRHLSRPTWVSRPPLFCHSSE